MGFTTGFGATINVINGSQECAWDSPAGRERAEHFEYLMNYFGVALNPGEDSDCSGQDSYFLWTGAASDLNIYFTKQWNW